MFKRLTKHPAFTVGNLIESVHRLLRRLDVELNVPAGAVSPGRTFHCGRRLRGDWFAASEACRLSDSLYLLWRRRRTVHARLWSEATDVDIVVCKNAGTGTGHFKLPMRLY